MSTVNDWHEYSHREPKKCPTCQLANQWSEVRATHSMTTTMAYNVFGDPETGRFHNHDGNVTTTYYECGRGHRFTESLAKKCWCGWSEEA